MSKHLHYSKEHCYSREEVEDFFASMDRDYDGCLSFEEFMGEESHIEKLFKNMDKDGDGLVTKKVQISNLNISKLIDLCFRSS